MKESKKRCKKIWRRRRKKPSTRRDSNPQPRDNKACVIPLCYNRSPMIRYLRKSAWVEKMWLEPKSLSCSAFVAPQKMVYICHGCHDKWKANTEADATLGKLHSRNKLLNLDLRGNPQTLFKLNVFRNMHEIVTEHFYSTRKYAVTEMPPKTCLLELAK